MRTALFAILFIAVSCETPTGRVRRNVLFIAVDDLRPNLGAYNFSLASTPNMDRLAKGGLTFKRSYAQYAYCAPSRNSLMSGRRPDTTRVWNFIDHFREPTVGAHWATLPGYFKKHGYMTLGAGKLFHENKEGTVPPDNDYAESWSPEFPYFSPGCKPPTCPSSWDGPTGETFHCIESDPPNDTNPTYCAANTTANETRWRFQLADQKIASFCMSHLRNAKKSGKNFFVGCGFLKPHTPWTFPAEFLNRFPSDLKKIPLPRNPYAPQGMPNVAWHYPGDVHGLDGVKFNESYDATRTRLYRRAYYAAVSYTDYNIGLVLDTLDELELTDNTVVLLFGDHGWQLGEHNLWAKQTNFELALRIPTIFRAPFIKSSVGQVTNVLAEAVDFYATLAQLAGLPHPRALGEEVNGTSLVPVFLNPKDTSCKTAAYSQFAKHSAMDIGPRFLRHETQIMGYSVRVDRWRYTAWFGFNPTTILPDINFVMGRELYAHHGEENNVEEYGEDVNLMEDPRYTAIADKLHKQILDHIRVRPSAYGQWISTGPTDASAPAAEEAKALEALEKALGKAAKQDPPPANAVKPGDELKKSATDDMAKSSMEEELQARIEKLSQPSKAAPTSLQQILEQRIAAHEQENLDAAEHKRNMMSVKAAHNRQHRQNSGRFKVARVQRHQHSDCPLHEVFQQAVTRYFDE